MHRRRFLASATAAGAAAVTRIRPARAAREILVAEPVHSTGYLPLYIAMAKGFFDDVTVKLVTIETGSGHTNAVLSGQAFAFIGGPEHNAFAKAKGAELRAVIGCVDRGNVYLCAAPGQEPKNADWPSYFKGKTIAVGPVGGTPNSILRYLLGKWKLDARRDVTLIETANSATIAVVRGRQAQIGEATEPFVTQGVRNKVWGEPFFNAPKELGPYAYSTINVRLDSIRREPELVRTFVRGMAKGLQLSTPTRPRPPRSPRRSSPPCRPRICGRRSTVRTATKCGPATAASAARRGRPPAPWCARPASSRRISAMTRSST